MREGDTAAQTRSSGIYMFVKAEHHSFAHDHRRYILILYGIHSYKFGLQCHGDETVTRRDTATPLTTKNNIETFHTWQPRIRIASTQPPAESPRGRGTGSDPAVRDFRLRTVSFPTSSRFALLPSPMCRSMQVTLLDIAICAAIESTRRGRSFITSF